MGRDRRVTALGLGRSFRDTDASRQLVKRRCCEASMLRSQVRVQSYGFGAYQKRVLPLPVDVLA